MNTLTTNEVSARSVGSARVFPLEVAFVVSGFCGLIYESIWSHYLKLFVGHAAYAQSIVLVVFIGGMALGAWGAGRISHRVRWPLMAYAAVEFAVGVGSLAFHGVYVRVTDWSLESVLPLVCSPDSPCALQWVIAALLILPQSILLGTTFPLMTSSVLRIAPAAPGRRIANLYFLNSIGAVAGVLASGFYLIPTIGLPGTLLSAGLLNIAVAIAVYFIAKTAVARSPREEVSDRSERPGDAGALLLVSALTGLSSFVYEVVWIRMLSLVIGSSTHAFEVMLAAFILGLALGGLIIRGRIDRFSSLRWVLAVVQILMGILAVATLPLYDATYDALAWAMRSLSPTEGGYALYNATSQGLAMAVMLPATICAGMTLPLITASLVRSGFGERSIGYVYAANTLGAIVGVVFAVHFAMPMLGAKGALLVAAAIDIGIGAWLIRGPSTVPRRRAAAGWIAAGIAALVYTGSFVHLSPERTASGVFRHGNSRLSGDKEVIFHRDGKTATVAVLRDREQRLMIATNGKIDAAMSTTGPVPAVDEYTMVMTGMMPLLYRPDLKNVAVIGFGSGMTTATLLGSPMVERVDTIEIESEMVNGARLFSQRVDAAFRDPRSRIIIDDAKSFFARGRTRYDAIVSEPSNPWVSGVASLFTIEFYRRIKGYLTDEGLLVQWIQTYEITDELVASILRSIHAEFADYALFASQPGDMIIVAAKTRLPSDLRPDALGFPALKSHLERLHFGSIDEFEVRRLAGRSTVGPLLGQYGHVVNSDYHPIVDTLAPQARFMRSRADFLTQLPVAPVPIVEMLEGRSWDGVRLVDVEPTVGRRGEAAEARTFARWLVEGVSERDSGVVTFLPREITLARAALWNCASMAPTVSLVDSLVLVAGQVNPHLSPSEATAVWSAVAKAPCYARLGASERRWMDLFHAVGSRSAAKMGLIGIELLAGDNDMDSNLREYATLAAATGLMAQGLAQEARAVLDVQAGKLPRERQRLPWLLAIRGKAAQVATSP